MKEKFEWKNDYSVGVKDMDNDHKKILSIGLEILQGSGKIKKEAIKHMLDEITQESVRHFAKEEELMSKTHYPQADDHHEKHEKLIAEIGLFIKQYMDDHMDTAHLADFLFEWILQHILNEDKKYEQHFHQQGIN